MFFEGDTRSYAGIIRIRYCGYDLSLPPHFPEGKRGGGHPLVFACKGKEIYHIYSYLYAGF